MSKLIFNYLGIVWLIMLSFNSGIARKVSVSTFASWDQNAITVAGYPNGTNGSSLSQLSGPIGIWISENDVLYVTDSDNHRIVVVPLNSVTNTFTIGSGPGSSADQFSVPYDIFITNTSVYVSDFGNHRVQNLSLNGTNHTTIATLSPSCRATYLFVYNLDNIFLTAINNHTVLLWNADTKSVSIVAGTGESGINNSQLYHPYGIFVDYNRNLYVADSHNHRVMKWFAGASAGILVAGTGIGGSHCTQLSTPTQIILDENEYMYISESGNGRVTRWASNSFFGVCIVACTGGQGTASTELKLPRSHIFDRNGSLYVSEFGNHRVQKFQILDHHAVLYNPPKFPPCTSWNSPATSIANISTFISQLIGIFLSTTSTVCNISLDSRLTTVTTSATNISGNLIVSHNLFVKINSSIYLDNSDFQYRFDKRILELADCFTAKKFVHRCISIFIDINNTFYCSLKEEHRVVQLLQSQNSCAEITITGNGTDDSSPHSLRHPHGIFVDINLNLYVADSENNRIQLFQPGNRNGSTVAGNKALSSSGLNFPTAVVVDDNGYLFIADCGHHRIIRSHENGFRCIVGCSNNSSSAFNELHYPWALWFDSFGNMFVLDKNNSRIQRFPLSTSSCDERSTSCLAALTCWSPTRSAFNCSFSNTSCDLLKPCQNDGTCYNNDTVPCGYTCLCPHGFSGADCGSDDRPCKSDTCWNNGTCNETSPTEFNCTCAPGWEGVHCERKIDHCHNITCENRGICRALFMDYSCECLTESYSGRHCEVTAQKIIIYKIVAKSFAYIAIIAITCVAMFVIIMDILKYCFGIDPAGEDLERIRRAKQEKTRKPVVQRSAYINAPPTSRQQISTIEDTVA